MIPRVFYNVLIVILVNFHQMVSVVLIVYLVLINRYSTRGVLMKTIQKSAVSTLIISMLLDLRTHFDGRSGNMAGGTPESPGAPVEFRRNRQVAAARLRHAVRTATRALYREFGPAREAFAAV